MKTGDTRAVPGGLERAAKRFASAKRARDGEIAFHLSGKEHGTFVVRRKEGRVDVATEAPADPQLEVFGAAETIEAILDGKVDAREQFLKGGLRVRGDLRYLSDLAMELGILRTPL